MSELRINNITNSGGNGGPVVAGVSTVSTSTFMVIPNGNTNDVIDYVTIATLGNAVDFGDSTVAKGAASAFSSRTRVCNAGGYTPSLTNLIEYVQIMSTGNGTDFGDMTHAPQNTSGCSNGHGGLG